MLNISQIEAYYSYFYKKRYSLSKYDFKSTKTTRSVCNSFLDLVDKEYSLHSVGHTFLWQYFVFQFDYWNKAQLDNKFSDKVVIGWIIGKKAFERWVQRDKEFDWQISAGDFLTKYGFDINELVKIYDLNIDRKPVNTNTYDSSKSIRKQFLNTERGFAICVQQTTLFDPKDLSCIKCNSRVECKELLRVNYPRIFNSRIVQGGKNGG